MVRAAWTWYTPGMASDTAGLRNHTQTQAYEVFEYRRAATWKGIGKGLLAIVVTSGITAFVLLRSEAVLPTQPVFWYWVFGVPAAILIVYGLLRWRTARHDDLVHRQFQQAPSMPQRLVRDHDDAWLEGKLRCPRPITPPHYSLRCSWYHLKVEERRGSGKNRRWVTVLDQTRRTRAWFVDGTREIEIDMGKASVDYPIVTSKTSGDRRFSLRRVPASGRISACGVVLYRKDVRRLPKDKARIEEPETPSGADAIERAVDARSPDNPEEALPKTKSFQVWRPRHEKSQVREEERAIKRGRASRKRSIRRARARRRRRAARRGSSGVESRWRPRRKRRMRYRTPMSDWHAASLDELHGVPPEKRLILTAHRHVPLMITPLKRARWHDRSEADERSVAAHGTVMLAYGIPALVWTLGCMGRWWAFGPTPGVPIGIAVMLAVLLPSKIAGRYNRMVVYRRRIPNAQAYLDVDLKMRHTLVPQLVAVVKGYVEHERGALTLLSELRSTASGGGDLTGRLMALREAYPDVDAQPNFTLLFDDITALEEKIAFGRALLRDSITEYNNLIESFPSNLLAAMTGFKVEPLPSD